MPAATTDLLKKYKSLFSTTLSTGIGTGTSDTITPASVEGLPTDTLITLTFDRVDSGGSATPTKLERIKGIISGGNFTSYTRGVDGTTEQAHAGGAVIEMIWNAADWNDAITWGLTEHSQLGTHTAITANSLAVASGITASNITASNITASNITSTNLTSLKNVTSTIVTTAGGTTTYTLTPSPAITAYATGQEFLIKMNATNTGASTINVSGLGAKSLTKGGATALASSDLLIDAVYKIVYDGTQFQVSGIGGSSATVATQAEVATGTSNTLMVTPLAVSRWHMPPQGFLYNGKIVPSVSSNNLTVALKTLAGTDPSSSDPVYVRIGDTVRSITAALSVTKNAGTNWCNAGSAELATNEIDYFVYLGYNATDGVVIGFSRVPYATKYGDFSSTTTAETYCAISTITTAASTDYYEVIGRFAATLSAGAGYTWSVPTFTAANLIQRPVYETRWLSFAPTLTGVSSPTSDTPLYLISGRNCTVTVKSMSGTSTGTSAKTFVAPLAIASGISSYAASIVMVSDNGANQSTPGHLEIGNGSSTVSAYKTFYEGSWTGSGSCAVYIPGLNYRIA